MTTKDKQYSIYIRSSNLRVPCTKEQFDDYYRDINAYRRTQMNHGRCVCPPSKRLHCDMDCLTCPYHTNGDMSSLDDTFISKEGEEHSYIEVLEDTSPMIDDILADGERLRNLFIKLNTLMPEAIEIGKLREEGLSEDSIAKRIGIGRKTYAYRLKKVKKQLEEEFPELF